MTILKQTYQNRVEARLGALRKAASLLAEGKSPVIILSSQKEAHRLFRFAYSYDGAPGEQECKPAWDLGCEEGLARSVCMGVRVLGFDEWLAGMWDLYGDGRRVVTPEERLILLSHHLERYLYRCMPAPQTVRRFGDFARNYLQQICDMTVSRARDCGFTTEDSKACMALNAYKADLDRLGLIEPCMMLPLLPPPNPNAVYLWLAGDSPSFLETLCFDGLSKYRRVIRFEDCCVSGGVGPGIGHRCKELGALLSSLPQEGKEFADARVESTGAVKVLLPSGRYAAYPQISHELLQYLQGHVGASVAIACNDPLSAYRALYPKLARVGVSAGVSYHRAFQKSTCGQALCWLLALRKGEGHIVDLATDYAMGPCSGISLSRAQYLNAQWRLSRLVNADELIGDLAKASEHASRQLALLEQGEYAQAFEQMTQVARPHMGQAEVQFMEASRNLVRRWEEVSQSSSYPFDALVALCGEARLSACLGEGAQVRFMCLDELAENPCESFDIVLICDLNSADDPLRPAEGPDTIIAQKLGLALPDASFRIMRRRFFHAVETARDGLWLQRNQHDADGNAQYPAIALEETFDCYRLNLQDDAELDEATGVPKALGVATYGENAIGRNVCPREVLGIDDLPKGDMGQVSAAKAPMLARSVAVDGVEYPVLSPSAIEEYLDCPCKWLTARRLRLEGLDSQLGALEMGNFSHAVLRKLFVCLEEMGCARITSENAAQAIALASEIFEEYLQRQYELAPRSLPMIPVSQLDHQQVARLRQQLLSFVERQVSFLPGFTPRHFELPIDASEGLLYGGMVVNGCVDRIDVDSQGNAVIVDYKGSLSDSYALKSLCERALPCGEGESALLPQKMQTLIYAQIIRRKLGYRLVGALYVSYGNTPKVDGAYDPRYLGEHDAPGIKASHADISKIEAFRDMDFHQVLDYCEDVTGKLMAPLLKGVTCQAPNSPSACKYCPMLSCERRGTA